MSATLDYFLFYFHLENRTNSYKEKTLSLSEVSYHSIIPDSLLYILIIVVAKKVT